MNKIRDNIYLGSYRPATDLELLKANGITAILNVALEIDDPNFYNDGIIGVKIGLGDNNSNRPHLKKLAVDILERLLDSGEIVYVHCAAGASRSPYVVGKYLERKERRDNHDVMIELHDLRPEVFERTPLHDD